MIPMAPSNRPLFRVIAIFLILILQGCMKSKKSPENTISSDSSATGFDDDVNFLKKFTEIIVLKAPDGNSKIAISPALQGRVMTSTSEHKNGFSFGWINRQAFLSGDTSDHMNAFGGEDRVWLGPEGGQYSIYFVKGKEFTLDNWHVPRLIDLDPFNISAATPTSITFTKEAELTNFSGNVFNFGIERKVTIKERSETLRELDIDPQADLSIVAFETINTLKNMGETAWTKKNGLLSIWILGMFNPSDNTTIFIPYEGKAHSIQDVVNDNYFGKVPEDRLKLDDKVVYFKGDGKYRSKIGFFPDRAREWLGSYNPDNNVLTLVKYNKPDGVRDYVNSLWEIQKEPFKGDVINAYNDGPPSPGAKPLGPFYELETSSPAAALGPGETITHIHSTYHLKGTPRQLDPLMLKVLGITTANAVTAFQNMNK